MSGMFDTSYNFEPTFSFTGTLYDQLDDQPPLSGLQKTDCEYPPSFARTQNVGAGISDFYDSFFYALKSFS